MVTIRYLRHLPPVATRECDVYGVTGLPTPGDTWGPLEWGRVVVCSSSCGYRSYVATYYRGTILRVAVGSLEWDHTTRR